MGHPADCSSPGPELGGRASGAGDRFRPTVVVVSEFGRTFHENGDRGTDHGHGSVYWLLGGGIKGGWMAGEQVAATQGIMDQNRDYPALNDYRSLMGGLVGRSFDLARKQLQATFPSAEAAEASLV